MTRQEYLSLKAGDKVICNTNIFRHQYTRDQIYILREGPNEFDYVRTIKDDKNNYFNGIHFNHFNTLTPELENYYNFPDKIESILNE